MMESANSGNSEKSTPQNHNHSIPNTTTSTPLEPPNDVNATLPLTNDQTNLESNLHQTSSVIEQGNETLTNNPFVEPHISPLENNSSQNPFLVHSNDMHGHPSSNTPPTHEPSQANPLQVPINTTTSSQKVVENHDHVHESSGDDDIPISSIPNEGHQNNGSLEIQNPPIQVMERSEGSANSSAQQIPLDVFSRNKSIAQWSTVSNESLFSIQMGNTSFSSDIFWLNNKSGDFDHKPSDMPLLQTQQQSLTKFNDISQSSAAQQQECLRLTEEKAAETMREVIMETSVTTTGNTSDKGNLISDNGATRSSWVSSSNNDHSHHSDGSAKSFAFKVLTDGDKTPSKYVGQQQQKSQQQTFQETETSNAAQNPKSTSNASQKSSLSCFSCCH